MLISSCRLVWMGNVGCRQPAIARRAIAHHLYIHSTPKSITIYTIKTADKSRPHAQSVRDVWAHLVQSNADFQVLVCLVGECRLPSAHDRTARDRTPFNSTRPQLNCANWLSDIQSFPGSYDHSSVQMPPDGSFPQPVIQVHDGFRCKQCPFMTQDHSNIRKHANKEHGQKRARGEGIFSIVRLRSWFSNGKERYWVVDEEARPVPARQPGRT